MDFHSMQKIASGLNVLEVGSFFQSEFHSIPVGNVRKPAL
jgi:hypothetical protein